MQSYKKKYPKGSIEANRILKVTKEKGREIGQRYAGVKDYCAWLRWLEYATGNPNFGICPTCPEKTESLCSILHAKAHTALNKWIFSLDARIEAERCGLEAERELRLLLLKYYEAKIAYENILRARRLEEAQK